MLYIWIKSGVGDECLNELEEKGLLKKSWVKTDGVSGERYISNSSDLLCPAAKIPRLPASVVSRVTFMEDIHDNFRPEGTYKIGRRSKLLIKTHANNSYKGMADAYKVLYYQKISASAPTLGQLKKIYGRVRTGDLLPEPSWESGYFPNAATEQ